MFASRTSAEANSSDAIVLSEPPCSSTDGKLSDAIVLSASPSSASGPLSEAIVAEGSSPKSSETNVCALAFSSESDDPLSKPVSGFCIWCDDEAAANGDSEESMLESTNSSERNVCSEPEPAPGLAAESSGV